MYVLTHPVFELTSNHKTFLFVCLFFNLQQSGITKDMMVKIRSETRRSINNKSNYFDYWVTVLVIYETSKEIVLSLYYVGVVCL